MKHRNSTYKIIIILITTLSALLFVTKDSYASNPSVVGFIIEASQMEGTLQTPEMSVGNTSIEKSRSMLKLTFENLTCKDLVIKKMVKTSKGIITTRMTSNDKILFENLSLSVTNAEYSEAYVPEKGNIGLKNAKLLAHNVKTVSSTLPQFQLSFNEGGEVELSPKSEAELLQMKAGLEYFLSNNQQ